VDIAALAVDRASRLGASEAEAFVKRARTVQIGFSREVEDVKTAVSTGLGLRVILGKRAAMYSTSILDEGEVDVVVERALKVARVTPENRDWSHLNREYGKSSVRGVHDKAVEAIDYEEVMDKVHSALGIMNEADGRVKPTRGMLSLTSSETSIANSYGDAVDGRGTVVIAWIRVKAEEAGLESTAGEHVEARSLGEVDLDSLAGSAVERALGYLQAKPVPGGEMPVIVRNQVAASIIGVMLSSPINADVVQRGGSPFGDRLGEQVAADHVTVVDHGVMPGGLGTRPFDHDGHPTQKTQVIVGGVLESFLYDSYTSLKAGVDSTGNARRSGYSSPPKPAPTNLLLEKGAAGVEEIIQDTRRGLYVDETIGEWLSNPVSGNLNATVTHGYLVEDGELTQPVKGVVLAGNFHELLMDGFEILGDDLGNSGGFYSPTVKFSKLTVAGE